MKTIVAHCIDCGHVGQFPSEVWNQAGGESQYCGGCEEVKLFVKDDFLTDQVNG